VLDLIPYLVGFYKVWVKFVVVLIIGWGWAFHEELQPSCELLPSSYVENSL